MVTETAEHGIRSERKNGTQVEHEDRESEHDKKASDSEGSTLINE
jgi:hypothetical protein